MAGFLDKVTDVINNTTSGISDKAKEFSEVSSLNGQIRSQEKIIENSYIEIGKAYYKANKDNEGDIYAVSMNKITEAEKLVAKLREDVANIKNK